VYSGSSKNENGVYLGPVDESVMEQTLDEVIGYDAWAPFPAHRISPKYQWGIALQGWPPEDILAVIEKLKIAFGGTVLVEPLWDQGT